MSYLNTVNVFQSSLSTKCHHTLKNVSSPSSSDQNLNSLSFSVQEDQPRSQHLERREEARGVRQVRLLRALHRRAVRR